MDCLDQVSSKTEFGDLEFYLVFTDGISTLNIPKKNSNSEIPLFIFSDNEIFDENFLKSKGNQSGGSFFNLKKESSGSYSNIVYR